MYTVNFFVKFGTAWKNILRNLVQTTIILFLNRSTYFLLMNYVSRKLTHGQLSLAINRLVIKDKSKIFP